MHVQTRVVLPLNGPGTNLTSLQNSTVSVVMIHWVAYCIKSMNLGVMKFRAALLCQHLGQHFE